MRRAVVLIAIVGMLALPALAIAATHADAPPVLYADLSGDQEVPPVDIDAGGSGWVTISDDESSITYEVTFSGLSGDPTAAHIHFGEAGVAGPVIIPLDHGPSPFSGTFSEGDYTAPDDASAPQTWAEALLAMTSGDTYINVHTALNPGGEIRGQLFVRPDGCTPAGCPPDTATEDGAPSAAPAGLALLLLVLGGLAFVAAFRRLSSRAEA